MAAKKVAKKAAKKPAAKKNPAKKVARKPAKAPMKTAAKRVGGRAGTAGKADGSAPVRAYIESLPDWKRDVARRLDDIIAREVPDVQRAVKWSVPFYGREGMGWLASFAAFSKHVKIQFFRGADLTPPPPLGENRDARALDLRSAEEFDEAQIRDWVRQAAKLPGWTA
jgi:hypothetical protein